MVSWYKLYLGGSTLVPGAVIKDVLPLLGNQDKVKIRRLKTILKIMDTKCHLVISCTW